MDPIDQEVLDPTCDITNVDVASDDIQWSLLDALQSLCLEHKLDLDLDLDLADKTSTTSQTSQTSKTSKTIKGTEKTKTKDECKGKGQDKHKVNSKGEDIDDSFDCCDDPNIMIEDGHYYCVNCCTVNGCVIDGGAEWRFYGSDDCKGDDPNRCGMPTNELLPKSSLGSVIGYGQNSKTVRQIRMYQLWNSMPYWERSLYGNFDKVTSTIANHNIPAKVLADAKVLIKKVSEKKISRGDNKEGVIASCIYYSCLLNNTPRSTKEIAKIFHIDHNVLTRGNARFQSLLKINVKSTSADDFVARFGSRLSLTFDDIQVCKRVAQQLDELDIVSESSPTSIAAAVLHYYCTNKKLSITKLQIAAACQVSAVTITKCHKQLIKWSSLIPI